MTTPATLASHVPIAVAARGEDADDPDPPRSSGSYPAHDDEHHARPTDRTPRADTHAGIGIEIDLIDATHRVEPPDRAWLRDRLADACAHLGVHGEARVRIIGDAEMADAHERYAGVPGTTDVLTFDLTDGIGAREALDVDLMICLDEAQRRAADAGHNQPRRELLLYALHGVLHCLGEDDHTDAGYQQMHTLEDAVLTAIGVGPVFRTPGPDNEPKRTGADR